MCDFVVMGVHLFNLHTCFDQCLNSHFTLLLIEAILQLHLDARAAV